MSRVLIREHIKEDLPCYIEWQTDPDVSKYLSWLPKTEEESKEDFAACMEDQTRESRTNHYLAIVLVTGQDMVGDVGITLEQDRIGEIGWFLRRKYWGYGYGADAATLMINYGFENLHLKSINATCHPLNRASNRVMEKCGLEFVKENGKQNFFSLERNKWEQGV